MMKVKNKTILVTGAGSGIGRALCQRLISKNARVIGLDMNADALEETKKICGVGKDKFMSVICSVTDEKRISELPKEINDSFGPVDGIINNAGIIQKFVMIKDLSIEDVRKVMDVNFYGTVYMIKAFLPSLLQRPEAHIVNISSMGGFLPVPGQSIYGASKAAVKLMTEGLYSELQDTGVRVTVIFPGAVETNISVNSGLDVPTTSADAAKFKALKPEAAATKIIDAMEKNAFRATVGPDASFLDKLYRLSPVYATNFIRKKMSSLLKQ